MGRAATSATISEGPNTREKLAQFVADLAGQNVDSVRVIEGLEAEAALPAEGSDITLDPTVLANLHIGGRMCSSGRSGVCGSVSTPPARTGTRS